MPKGIRSLANGGPPNPFGGPAITGGGGITPIKMQAAQVRFPTARGPVRRAPEPEISEILGPLLGFGANSVLSGLGGLFGKDKNIYKDIMQASRRNSKYIIQKDFSDALKIELLFCNPTSKEIKILQGP